MATRRWISEGGGDWASTSNWSGAAVPTSGDTVIFARNPYSVTGSLDQSAVTNITLIVEQSYIGTFGDKDNYLKLGCSSVEIGRDDANLRPPGSARLNLDIGTVASTVTILNTGAVPADDGFQCVRMLANNNATQIRARRGRVSLASLITETSTVDDIQYGEEATDSVNHVMEIGSGVTMDDLNVRGGLVKSRTSIDVVNVWGGRLETEGAGTIAGVRVRGGNFVSNSTGTITTATVSNGGTLDLSRSAAARTVTTINIIEPCRIITHPNVTITNLVPSSDRPLSITVGAA